MLEHRGDRDRAALADEHGPAEVASRARAAAWSPGGRSACMLGRPSPRFWTSTRDAGRRDRAGRSRGSARRCRSGSWFATSRQLTLAWAWAGMIVLLPSPWKPPQMPLTSSVGRAPRRSRTVKSGLADERRDARSAPVGLLVEGQLRRARSRSASSSGDDLVVEARDADPAVRALQRR